MTAMLTIWQQDFVNELLSQPPTRSLLVAAAGTGKTTTALFAAHKLLEHGVLDSVFVISDQLALRDYWRHAASLYGMELENSLESHLGRHGVSVTLQSLKTNILKRGLTLQQRRDAGSSSRTTRRMRRSHSSRS